MTCRLSSSAHPAVLSAPLRRAASTSTVPRVSAAISRLRARKRGRVGADPGGCSDTTANSVGEVLQEAAGSARGRPGRPRRPAPPPWRRPPAAWRRGPRSRCPSAPPETTGTPAAARCSQSIRASSRRRRPSAAREPTTATEDASSVSGIGPFTHSPGGVPPNPSHGDRRRRGGRARRATRGRRGRGSGCRTGRPARAGAPGRPRASRCGQPAVGLGHEQVPQRVAPRTELADERRRRAVAGLDRRSSASPGPAARPRWRSRRRRREARSAGQAAARQSSERSVSAIRGLVAHPVAPPRRSRPPSTRAAAPGSRRGG